MRIGRGLPLLLIVTIVSWLTNVYLQTLIPLPNHHRRGGIIGKESSKNI